jgi:pimeloyl-ACP methyl ester carboxylesterase
VAISLLVITCSGTYIPIPAIKDRGITVGLKILDFGNLKPLQYINLFTCRNYPFNWRGYTLKIILSLLALPKLKIMKYLLVFSLSILVISGCYQSKTKTMDRKTKSFETKMDSGYAGVNGIKMYYEIHGEGEPLVLIHGGGSTIQTSFSRILPLFAQHYKVIAVELQAHGHTSDRDTPESFEQDADDVAALCKHLSINKACFLGFSNGGNTAMRIAMRHPELVNKLILISSFYKREGMMTGFFEGMNDATIDNMPELLKTYYLQINNDQKALMAMFTKDRDRMIGFKDWSDDELRSINAPTFLICGDHDVVTSEHTVMMSQLIPNAQLMILPGTHGSFIGEVCSVEKGSKIPEMTAGIIKEFLNKPGEEKK